MVLVMRRVAGLVALLSLLASPVVAQRKFVCRYTGLEISDCAEQRIPERPVVQDEGCCDRRVVPALSAFVTADQKTSPAAPVVALSALAVASPRIPNAPRLVDARPALAASPPLFLTTCALLI
jgi:hypothetical protein